MRLPRPTLSLLLMCASCSTANSADDNLACTSQAYPCSTTGSLYLEAATETSGNCGPTDSQVVDLRGGPATDADPTSIALPNTIECDGFGSQDGCTTRKNCSPPSIGNACTYDFTLTFAADGNSASGNFSVTCPASGGRAQCASSYDVALTRQ